MVSKHISTCIVGHRKTHRGLFSRQRVKRWWRKHDHSKVGMKVNVVPGKNWNPEKIAEIVAKAVRGD